MLANTRTLVVFVIFIVLEHLLFYTYTTSKSRKSDLLQRQCDADAATTMHLPSTQRVDIPINIVKKEDKYEKYFGCPAPFETKLLPKSKYMREAGNEWPWEHVYVLNLDRKPDKWAKMKQVFKTQLNLTLHEDSRFSAIDGKVIIHGGRNAKKENENNKEEFWNQRVAVVNELIKAEILASPCEFNGLIAPGSFGNYLSFRKLFRQAMKKYDQILVAEDDIIFHSQFKDLFWRAYRQVENDTSWDFIFVGISRFKRNDCITPYTEHVWHVKGDELEGAAFGAYAFIIRKKGMQQFVKYSTLPMRVQSDVMMGFLMSGKNERYPKVIKGYYFQPDGQEIVGPHWEEHTSETSDEFYHDSHLSIDCKKHIPY